MYTVERYHDFSCGHRVVGHESKCAWLHGHNYRITFTCAPIKKEGRKFIGQGERSPDGLDQVGRVIDFSIIKSTLCEWLEQNWDHKTLLWEQDPLLANIQGVADGFNASRDPNKMPDPNHHIVKFIDSFVVVPFNPTAENMAQYLVQVVGPALLKGSGVALIRCHVEETRKCSATFSI